MKDYVIINGVSSKTKTGLAINILPPITKPEMRTLVEEIDGRDGDIITKLGYSAYDKTIEIGLFGNGYDVDDIIAFFNKEGTIVFSNEPTKYYNFTLVDSFDIERLLQFKTSTITFHCQPFKYEVGETPKEIEYDYVSGEETEITLNNTMNALMQLELNPSELTQETTPTPDNPSEVQVIKGNNSIVIENKNLFKESQLLNATNWALNSDGYYNGTLGNYNTAFQNGFTFNNKFKDNTQYIITLNAYTTGGTPVIKFEYTDNTSVNLVLSATAPTDYTYTTTEGKTLSKIVGTYGSGGTNTMYIKNIMLRESSTTSDYVAHQEQVLPLNLGTIEYCKIGNYEDEFEHDGDKWYINKAIGKVVLDGSENWTTQSMSYNYAYQTRLTDIKPNASDDAKTNYL